MPGKRANRGLLVGDGLATIVAGTVVVVVIVGVVLGTSLATPVVVGATAVTVVVVDIETLRD